MSEFEPIDNEATAYPPVPTGGRWHETLLRFVRLPEFWSLCIGLVTFLCVAGAVFIAFHLKPSYGRMLSKIIVSHIAMGAPVGAVEAAKYPAIALWQNILFNSLLTITIICFFNTLFGLSCRGFLRIAQLHDTFKGVAGDARKQRQKWARLGIPGVFIFVFIPLPGTGPVIGSLLARYMGLGYWGMLGTVVTASVTSITAWGYAADKLQQYVGSTVLRVFVWCLLLTIITIPTVVKIRTWIGRKRGSAVSGGGVQSEKSALAGREPDEGKSEQ